MPLCVVNFCKNDAVNVFADSPAPQLSYKIEIENGRKFFYMQGSEYYRETDKNFLDLEPGLYYSYTLENIYLIEPVLYQGTPYLRYIYEGSLVISEDGRYFANLPWTSYDWSTGRGGTAIEFYKDGCLVKQYVLSDLVKMKQN